MPDIQTGSYRVIQFYPNVATGEFVNVGIVMIDPYKNQIDVMLPDTLRELKKLCWVSEEMLEIGIMEIKGFISRLKHLSRITTEPSDEYSRLIFSINEPSAYEFISEFYLKAGGHIQLKESLPCSVSNVDLTLKTLFYVLVITLD